MKRLLFIGLLATAITSCEKPRKDYELNTIDGSYNVDLTSVYISGWGTSLPNTDTTFYNLCTIMFDHGTMFTLVNDTIQPIPLLGFNFQYNYAFNTEKNGDTLIIGGEIWTILEDVNNNGLSLSRVTDYFGMGTDLHTIKLTEL